MNIPDEITIYAKNVLGIARAAEIKLTPLPVRGSDRSYYRMQYLDEQSVILVHYNPERRENALFADIADYLDSIHIPVARILGHESILCFIVMQDLGDTDLWALREASWKKRKDLYQKILSILYRLHSYPARSVPTDRIKLADPFGADLYRWERNYFMENFVNRLCGIYPESGFLTELEAELAALAENLLQYRKCLVHRDLQSQNIMIDKGDPYFIDFQGMCFGTRFYDLGSLLYDPYMPFSENEREELLLYYFQLSPGRSDWNRFRKAFLEASAQRLMQALGAYGFLGTTRDLKDYLKHVRPGLENLCSVVQGLDSLPCLKKLASQCRNRWSDSGQFSAT